MSRSLRLAANLLKCIALAWALALLLYPALALVAGGVDVRLWSPELVVVLPIMAALFFVAIVVLQLVAFACCPLPIEAEQ